MLCFGISFFALKGVTILPFIREVERLPKYIRKNLVRQIQKNLRNINWYSCYELFKTGKFHTFLASFIILLSCPEWFMSCFATSIRIFSNITYQPVLREAQPNMAPFFSKHILENIFLQKSYLCPGLVFNIIQQIKNVQSSHGFLFKLSLVLGVVNCNQSRKFEFN